jgi:hypothetical protein
VRIGWSCAYCLLGHPFVKEDRMRIDCGSDVISKPYLYDMARAANNIMSSGIVRVRNN